MPVPYSLNQIGGAISEWWWFGIGLVLLLIIAQVSPRIGGWLLIIVVMGLLYNAHNNPQGSLI